MSMLMNHERSKVGSGHLDRSAQIRQEVIECYA